jgi:diacylglycerol kinase (ATP)
LKKRILIVSNPNAGKFSLERIEQVRDKLSKSANVLVYTTKDKNDESGILKACENHSADTICVCGGDGSLHMCINALDYSSFSWILVPMGSANDLFASLQNRSKNEFNLSVFRCNDRVFINGMGIGLDAEIAYDALVSSIKNPSLKYIWAIVRNIFTNKASELTLKTESKEIKGKYLFLAAMNSPQYGNGFQMAPGANPEDEELNLTLVSFISKTQRLMYVGKLKKGQHQHLDFISTLKSSAFQVSSNKSVKVQLDGEVQENSFFSVHFDGKMKLSVTPLQ